MTATDTAVGFIGLGLLGLPIVERLIASGVAVTCLDLDEAKMAAAEAAGARRAGSAAALARAHPVVMLCVTGTASVQALCAGEAGLAAGAGADSLIVDLSTTDAQATRDLAARLREASGAGWVDAPVSGGPPAAREGQLTIMAGGGEADATRAARALAPLAGRFTHMGPVGAGQVTKMINQVLVLNGFCVLAEALKLAENGGIDAARLPECLAGGYADSALLQRRFAEMAGRDFDRPTGYARQVLKDLDLVYDLAKATATATPMTDQARMLYRLYVSQGNAEAEAVSIVRLFDTKR